MVDLEFRNKITGCGTNVIISISSKDIKKLKDCLNLPGIDIEVTALKYPYRTTNTKNKGGERNVEGNYL